jgi:hypothetical protein
MMLQGIGEREKEGKTRMITSQEDGDEKIRNNIVQMTVEGV